MKPELIRTCFLLLALSVAAPQSPAQDKDPSPFDLIPAGTHIVVSMDGPAALAKKFAGTRLHKLLGSDAVAELVQKHRNSFEPILKKKLEALSFDLDELQKQLLDYSGKLVLAIHLGDRAIDFSDPPPELTVTVLLSPDGRTPLKQICTKVAETIQEEHSDRLEEVEFEGRRFSHVPSGDHRGGEFLVPFMHRGHLCLCFAAKDPRVVLRRILNPEQKQAYRPSARLADKGFFVRIDLRSLMGFVRRSIQQLDEDQDTRWTNLFDELGCRSLEHLEIMTEARPPYVVQETRLQLNARRAAALFALFPDKPGPSPLQAILPVDVQKAGMFFLDLTRLHAAVMHAGFTEVLAVARLKSEFETMFDLRLKEDVLQHVSGHLLLLEQAATDVDGEEEEFDRYSPFGKGLQQIGRYCLAVSLRDPEAFARSLEKIVRKRGLHAARKTRDFKGFKIQKVNIMGLTHVHYAVTDRALILAVGYGGGVRAMQSALECEQRVTRGKEPLPLPKAAADRAATETDGHYAIGYEDLTASFRVIRREFEATKQMVNEGYEGGLEEAMRQDESVRAWLSAGDFLVQLSHLFKRFDLGTTTSVLRYKDRAIVYRSIW